MPRRFSDLAMAPRRGRPGTVVPFFDQFRGVNTTLPSNMLDDKEAVSCLNLKLNDQGKLVTREGLLKLSSTTMDDSAAIKHIAYIPISTSTYIFAVDANYKIYKYSGAEESMIPGAELATLEGDAVIVPFNGKGVILDGGYIKYTDGSTVEIAYDDGDGTSGYQHTNLCGCDDLAALTTLYAGGNTMAGALITTQSWTAGYTIPITAIEIWLSKSGSPTGDITAKLYKSDGSQVYETSTTTVSAADLTTAGTAQTFTFAGSYEFSPSTQYLCVVSYSGGDVSNYVIVHGTTVSSGGDMYYYDGSWHNTSTSNALIGVKPGKPPKGSFGDVKETRLFVAGDPDNPGYVWFTNVNTLFDWSTSDGGGYVSAVDDNANSFPVGGIIAHFVDRESGIGDLYVIGKAQQPYICKLVGSSPTNYSLPPLFQQIYTDHKQLLSVANDIWFASGDSAHNIMGVQEYGDIRTYSAGDPIKDKFKTYYSTAAFAGYNPADGQYIIKLSGYDYVLVCHTKHPFQMPRTGLIRYPWTFYQFKNLTPSAFASFDGKFYVGCTNGHLYRLDNTRVNDDSTQPDCHIHSGFKEFAFGMLKTREYHALLRSSAAATVSCEFYRNGSGSALLTKTLTASAVPIQGLAGFHCDSLQVRLTTFVYTAAVTVGGVNVRGSGLSSRGV